jgi:PhoH-like ATPase
MTVLATVIVPDTNVMFRNPEGVFNLGKDIVIPDVVLEEMDNHKKDKDLGYGARQAARIIDKLRSEGNLHEGLKLENGGSVRVETGFYDVALPPSWNHLKADNRILQVCKGLQDSGYNVALITNDIMERVKASVMDIWAEQFDDIPTEDKQYTGRIDLYLSPSHIELLKSNPRGCSFDEINAMDEEGNLIEIEELTINQYVIFNQYVPAVFDGKFFKHLPYENYFPYGVEPRNIGQKLAIDALARPAKDVPLVILKGQAGTAKTFLSLAMGLEKTVEEHEFRKILACRPNVMMDEEIGFLPGTEQEKIAPLMRPIIDNLEVLVDDNEADRYKNEKELSGKVYYLFNTGIIEMQAIAFLRGRTLPMQYIFIDEAQNLTPNQVKGIITRAGKGAKIVLSGDPDQIDHPHLNARNNGLTYASERFKGSKLCFQVTFTEDECERSDLAAEAAKRL